MEVGWDTLEYENIIAFEPESAQQLGMNMLNFANELLNWALEYVNKPKLEGAKHVSAAGSMNIAQVI